MAGEVGDAGVGFEITPVWAERPLVLGAEAGSDASGAPLTVSRLDFLLSHVALRHEDGSWLEPKGWSAFFRCDKARFAARIEGVPSSRKFTAIRFNIGLDAAADAADPAIRAPEHPLHPLANGLHRGVRGGYTFLAIEGRHQKRDGTFASYAYHLAGRANLMRVELPISLETSTAQVVRVAFDVGKIFRGTNALSIAVIGDSLREREGDLAARMLKANIEHAFRVYRVVTVQDPNLAAAAADTSSTRVLYTWLRGPALLDPETATSPSGSGASSAQSHGCPSDQRAQLPTRTADNRRA